MRPSKNSTEPKLLFLGDIMPGGRLRGQQTNFCSDELLALIADADYRVANLECGIGTDEMPFDPVKMADRCNVIYTIAEDLEKLKVLGVDAVSLANNHFYDLGEAGMLCAIEELDKRGIKHTGAGRNLEEASRPISMQIGKHKCAIIACCATRHVGYVPIADSNSPGLNHLEIKEICRQIRQAKQCHDKVFVMPHWGDESTIWPTTDVVAQARAMVEAGADAIIGNHSHRVQSMIRYKGSPVFYSLGNFLFPSLYLQPPRPVWFPTAEEIERFSPPVIRRYPYPLERHSLMMWRMMATIGMIVKLRVTENGSIKPSYRLSKLSDADYLSLYNNQIHTYSLKLRLAWIGLLSKCNYPFWYKIHKLFRRINRRIRRIIANS